MTPSIKVLIQRLENAAYQEGVADAALQREADATTAARRALTDEFDRLRRQVSELEAKTSETAPSSP